LRHPGRATSSGLIVRTTWALRVPHYLA